MAPAKKSENHDSEELALEQARELHDRGERVIRVTGPGGVMPDRVFIIAWCSRRPLQKAEDWDEL